MAMEQLVFPVVSQEAFGGICWVFNDLTNKPVPVFQDTAQGYRTIANPVRIPENGIMPEDYLTDGIMALRFDFCRQDGMFIMSVRRPYSEYGFLGSGSGGSVVMHLRYYDTLPQSVGSTGDYDLSVIRKPSTDPAFDAGDQPTIRDIVVGRTLIYDHNGTVALVINSSDTGVTVKTITLSDVLYQLFLQKHVLQTTTQLTTVTDGTGVTTVPAGSVFDFNGVQTLPDIGALVADKNGTVGIWTSYQTVLTLTTSPNATGYPRLLGVVQGNIYKPNSVSWIEEYWGITPKLDDYIRVQSDETVGGLPTEWYIIEINGDTITWGNQFTLSGSFQEKSFYTWNGKLLTAGSTDGTFGTPVALSTQPNPQDPNTVVTWGGIVAYFNNTFNQGVRAAIPIQVSAGTNLAQNIGDSITTSTPNGAAVGSIVYDSAERTGIITAISGGNATIYTIARARFKIFNTSSSLASVGSSTTINVSALVNASSRQCQVDETLIYGNDGKIGIVTAKDSSNNLTVKTITDVGSGGDGGGTLVLGSTAKRIGLAQGGSTNNPNNRFSYVCQKGNAAGQTSVYILPYAHIAGAALIILGRNEQTSSDTSLIVITGVGSEVWQHVEFVSDVGVYAISQNQVAVSGPSGNGAWTSSVQPSQKLDVIIRGGNVLYATVPGLGTNDFS